SRSTAPRSSRSMRTARWCDGATTSTPPSPWSRSKRHSVEPWGISAGRRRRSPTVQSVELVPAALLERSERLVQDLGLLLGVDGGLARGGGARVGAADAADLVDVAVRLEETTLDAVPRTHVLGLLLEPDDLAAVGEPCQLPSDGLVRPREQLLD